ncbi:hypothetical protein CDD80_980 [Ophiocordyceps camponoti-rufipedis]|uniref:Uncharacterized protein n=1 Tax=Ophiocordyceps camponoti-rufipedis TaxID=2004952 RepID=A0A2C5ZBF4_9HYPO|nr:hypothetical protein CDD80_980 [Ophiocordyceps camponoti-rufipedis]
MASAFSSPPELVIESQPWTAARCQRLLRQLRSRLAGLRRQMVDDGSSPPKRHKRSCEALEQHQAPKRVRFTYGSRRQSPASGAEQINATMLMTTPPRMVRTLGAMDLRKSSPTSAPFAIATPTWRKIREQPDTPVHYDASHSRPRRRILHEIDLSDLRNETRLLRRTVPEQRFRIYEAIILWFEGLLRSTLCGAQDPHRRSLLNICLREIPACIANIEAYDKHVTRVYGRQSLWDTHHVSSALYEQLEALGSRSRGWRPMKLALRAHAVWLLCEAIADGLLEPEFVRLLIRVCLKFDFRAEAGKLSSCIGGPIPPPRSVLSKMTENQGLLPLHEMMASLRGEAPSGVSLLSISSLLRGGSLPGLGIDEKTLISFVAGAVMAVTTMTAIRGVGQDKRKIRAWRRVLYVLELCLAELRRQQQRGYDNGQFILVLARHLVVVDSPFAEQALKRQTRAELKKMAQHGPDASATAQRCYHQAAAVLARLIQYRSRSSSVPGHVIVDDMFAKLDDIGIGGYFSTGLRTDVAFLLAQQTKDLRDLAFAESLPSARSHGLHSTVFPGWHWEEGISEWVLLRPVADNIVDRTADEILTQGDIPATHSRQLPKRPTVVVTRKLRESKNSGLGNKWSKRSRMRLQGEKTKALGTGRTCGRNEVYETEKRSLRLGYARDDSDTDELV